MDDKDWQKVAIGLGVALLGWIGLTIRKAIRNTGKTKLEIAQEQYEQALKERAEAAKTPDTLDDEEKQKLVELAKKHVDHEREWKAITDAVGDGT